MYVCLCYGVSDSDIRRAADEGAKSLAELSAQTGCATNCGCCAELAVAVLAEARGSKLSTLPARLPLVPA
jgi:bacterioferritin-associated ferredoxin